MDNFKAIDNATSSDGRTVKCNYLQNKNFDFSSRLCQQLHLMYLIVTPEVTYTTAYSGRSSINALLDFIAHYNNKHKSMKIEALEHINNEFVFEFQDYEFKNKGSNDSVVKFKGAIVKACQYNKQIPNLKLPKLKSKTGSPREPLTEEAFTLLSKALTAEIDRLYEKLEYRKEVEQAKPYQLDAVMQEIAPPRKTKENVFKWFQWSLAKDSKIQSKALRSKIHDCDDEELRTLSSEKNILQPFRVIFERDKANYNLPTEPVNTFPKAGIGVRGWCPNHARTIRTLLDVGYPFNISQEEFSSQYGYMSFVTLEQCTSIEKFLMHRYMRGRQKTVHEIPLWDDLLTTYFPAKIDMAAIGLFIMLQSGWNKEAVMALDINNFEHPLSGMRGKDKTVIHSEKIRGQGKDKPYIDAKSYYAPSSKTDKYSVYSLINLAIELSKPLSDKPVDCVPMYANLNPIFLFIRDWSEWARVNPRGSRVASISFQKFWIDGVEKLLRKYEIIESGRRLTNAKEITVRLRPTWFKYKREKNTPLGLLATQQGHSSSSTTDIYYDSSGVATQDRRKRLRQELESVTTLLRNRQFKGLISNSSSTELNQSDSIRLIHIPGHEGKNLWGCANEYKPSWPGSNNLISNGRPCRKISKCLGCKQIRIFEDSLPYLMERLNHLEECADGEMESEYSTHNAQEIEIIKYILDKWEDERALKMAARYLRKNSPLLPRRLNSLELILDRNEVLANDV